MPADRYTKTILTVIALLLGAIALRLCLSAESRSRLGASVARLPKKILEIAIEGLRKIQPLFLLALIVLLSCRLRLYINDSLLGDVWFRYRESSGFDVVWFWVMPWLITLFTIRFYRRFIKGVLPASRVLLLILPIISLLGWYGKYRWPRSYTETTSAKAFTPYTMDGRKGCQDANGMEVIEAAYEDVDCDWVELWVQIYFVGNSGQDYIPVKLNSKWGFLDRFGKMAIAPQFESQGPANWGLRPVKQNGRWGFVYAATGKTAIPFEYDGASPFTYATGMASPWAPVKRGGQWGYIDRTNRLRIPFRFDDADDEWRSSINEETYQARTAARPNWGQKVWNKFFHNSTHSPAWALARNGVFWGPIDSAGQFLTQLRIPSNLALGFLNCDTVRRQCNYGLRETDRVPVTYSTNWKCEDQDRASQSPSLLALPWLGDDGHVRLSWEFNCAPVKP
ncbi:MAG: WG repeat-containing protein [Bryobacteraceae bacterium]